MQAAAQRAAAQQAQRPRHPAGKPRSLVFRRSPSANPAAAAAGSRPTPAPLRAACSLKKKAGRPQLAAAAAAAAAVRTPARAGGAAASTRGRVLRRTPSGGRVVYCPVYCRTGKCSRRGRGCPYRHDPIKRAVCPRWLHGSCDAGGACPLQHQRRRELMPVCMHFLKARRAGGGGGGGGGRRAGRRGGADHIYTYHVL